MVDRVLLGKRGTEYGLWISKPGFDVKSTTNMGNLMLAPGMRVMQWIARGQVNLPWAGEVTVSFGSAIGFKALVKLHSAQYGNVFIEDAVGWTWLNETQIKIYMDSSNPTPPAGAIVVDYAVLGVPIG